MRQKLGKIFVMPEMKSEKSQYSIILHCFRLQIEFEKKEKKTFNYNFTKKKHHFQITRQMLRQKN